MPLPLLVIALVVGVACIAAGAAEVVRVIAATVAAGFAIRGWSVASRRERRTRGWLAIAVLVWLISEAARLVGGVAGIEPHVAELSVIGLAIAAAGTFVSAARERFRPVDEMALYLDATAVFCSLAAAVLVFGAEVVDGPIGMGIVLHAAFFAGVLAATVLLDLTTRVPFGVVGAWEVAGGLALGAAGYLGLLAPGLASSAGGLLHGTVATGALLVGHGAGAWQASEDHGERYRAVADRLRMLLPVASSLLTAAVAAVLIARAGQLDGVLEIAAAAGVGIVVIAAVVRQTLLLVDREQVLRRSRQLTAELTVAEAQYRSVVEQVPGVVYVAEAGQHGRWHFVSPKISDLLGYSPDEWTADPELWLSRIHPDDQGRMIAAEQDDRHRLVGQGRWEYRLIARDGRVVWVIDDEAVIARDEDGTPTMVQGILIDITERKDLEDQLRHQALHDPLTGLPNRVLFVDRLSHALIRHERTAGSLAVLFVDLDDFKQVNDTLGHAAGDDLLRLIAQRLSGVLRAADTVCRLGGDEFAFLVEDAPADQAEQIAQRVLEALQRTFEIHGKEVSLSASIGLAVREFPADAVGEEAADVLLRDADTAMYAAKRMGKGRIRRYDRRMARPSVRRRQMRAALEEAIGNDELFLEYQPIVELRTRRTIGREALVRWNHPHLGRVMPGDFVPLAERTGLIVRLGEWVLRRAVADLRAADGLISVNVSAQQLGKGDFSALVGEVLASHRLPTGRLVLELTESTLAGAAAGVETELERLQEMGVRVALDDFGSGYSSLEYLGRMPVDILKIDRSLVERVHVDPQREEVLRAIGHIADRLSIETIVEGIELDTQRDAVLALGFTMGQGFLFSPPVALDLPGEDPAALLVAS